MYGSGMYGGGLYNSGYGTGGYGTGGYGGGAYGGGGYGGGMDSRIVNQLERRFGIDMNGDGYIGGEGYVSMLERATGRDINGDGRLGRPHDVVPGFPAVYGNPSLVYGPGGQVIATNNPVRPGHHHRY